MSSIGIIIKNSLSLTTKLPAKRKDAWAVQQKMLGRLISRAEYTSFGIEHHFSKILRSHDRVEAFQNEVPIHTYEEMFKDWWRYSLEGEDSVCWPGKVEYFALSSGTSSGTSKYIPVTRAMLRAIQKSSVKQILSLGHCNLPPEFYDKNILMLGGSTSLDYNGIYFAGDLSGITTGNLPFWFRPFYKPGKEISKTKNWQDKLDFITKEAHKWDVGAIVGVPSWFQLLMERIIEHHKVKNIHEIWPNLAVFTHGGVAFDPYRKSFEALLGKPLVYMETYLASEGFIAYQAHPDAEGMRLHIRNGIFYEFIPFIDANVDVDGNVLPGAKAITINEVEEGVDYVLLLSTVAGAWRYIIGDVIRFTSVPNYEVKIMGRTKHYLSLCGEHLSVENMNKAIEMISDEFNVHIKEFTVAGVPYDNMFAHHWFISVEGQIDEVKLREKLDFYIKELNDDYRVERQHALKTVLVDIVPNEYFLGWLKELGKEGAQIKFPRVLKKEQISSWKSYLENNNIPVKVY